MTSSAPNADAATDALAQQIDALLPQTQCTQCGYEGCWPYAQAIASGRAPINQCPPGGAAGIAQLAALLGCEPLPLNPAHGTEKPLDVALIDESLCIGCTLCIQACPVDAIVGAAQRLHTVLPQYCTGCALCVAPCPMDCIQMRPVAPPRAWSPTDANRARSRMHARRSRLEREAAQQHQRNPSTHAPADQKQALVQAAIERARARRQKSSA